jgi:RNA-binding protein Tab2/Atab2
MGTIWELDFYSRPIVDDQQKKVWELLICESPKTVHDRQDTCFRYAQFCPSNQVNSAWLRAALETALLESGTSPDRIRFFRQPMSNMIQKACSELGLNAQLSRRTFALNQWLQDRMTTVYPLQEGYEPGNSPVVSFPFSDPQPLPDALRGQRWKFVTLPCQDFDDMPDWSIDFSEAFPLTGMELAPETPVPGLIIFSERALPLAGWMSGLDLVMVYPESQPTPALGKTPRRLILETGGSERWILASLATPELVAEAQVFEATKQAANQVHFLAIQSNPESEAFAGFWFLQSI